MTKRQQRPLTKPPAHPPGPIPVGPPQLRVLNEDQLEGIHQASLAILRRTGVVFRHPPALDLFRRAGARVSEERVYLEADLLRACLDKAPQAYTLRARASGRDVPIGPGTCAVMPAGGSPYVHDLDGVRRPGTLADLADLTKLSALAPQVDVVARKAVEPQDVPAPLRHLEAWRTVLTLSDKPAQSGFPGGRAEAEDALQMLALVHGGEAAVDGRPVAHCSVNVNSPLVYDRPMLESLLAFARLGQPVLISSFVMAGVTGPATLAGALAQHNAEVLAGVALVQLARPGTPVLYGTASSNADLRTAAPAIGSPESAVAIAACAQLANRYRLPCRGGGALTDSPVPDAQSNYERAFTLLASVLSGVNFLMHGLGVLESYLTTSLPQFVIDLDLLSMVRTLLQPLEVSPETLALEVIDRVGPGGFFLESPHTLHHARTAHFLPQVGARTSFDQWQQAGAQEALARAAERGRELLSEYTRPPLDPGVEAKLEAFTERRKRELNK